MPRDFKDLESNISRLRYIEKNKNLTISKSRLNNYDKLASRDSMRDFAKNPEMPKYKLNVYF